MYLITYSTDIFAPGEFLRKSEKIGWVLRNLPGAPAKTSRKKITSKVSENHPHAPDHVPLKLFYDIYVEDLGI